MAQSVSRAIRLRRLRFRAWHRGVREMDLILGRFADAMLDNMDEAGLDQFEELLETPDPDIALYIMQEKEPPDKNLTDLYQKLKQFAYQLRSSSASRSSFSW